MLVFVAFLIVFSGIIGSPPAEGQSPDPGEGFTYTFHREVDDGTGEYEGYRDDTRSEGRYEILQENGTHVRFRATYAWTYRNNEGLFESGAEDRTVDFFLATRRYASTTDLDEYDPFDGTTLAIWFWIPPTVRVGEAVQILDDTFLVTSLDAFVWSNWLPKRGIELRATGSGARDDSYGQFTYTYTDMYYFDRSTGFVIAERYRERNIGFWQGRFAEFDWEEDFDVQATTYGVPIDVGILALTWGGILTVAAGCVAIVYGVRWRGLTVSKSRVVPEEAKVRRVRALRDLPRVENRATRHFGPFLEDFARKAVLAKDVVAAGLAKGKLVGFAVYNREAKIGTVLCENTGIAETLRAFVGAKDFFSEDRHTVPDSIRAEAAQEGVRFDQQWAYNVFETYEVLSRSLAGADPFPRDPTLVSRMTPGDLREVKAVAARVYKVRAGRWLRAQLDSGDIGFVARRGGRIVGFAFATLADGHGRIHTNTVLPEHRNAGIGKELMRARLEALRLLGATTVITEIASWNLPSLQIAWAHGFRPVGRMFVETARTVRVKRTIVRR